MDRLGYEHFAMQLVHRSTAAIAILPAHTHHEQREATTNDKNRALVVVHSSSGISGRIGDFTGASTSSHLSISPPSNHGKMNMMPCCVLALKAYRLDARLGQTRLDEERKKRAQTRIRKERTV